jgi:hypothetical protein
MKRSKRQPKLAWCKRLPMSSRVLTTELIPLCHKKALAVGKQKEQEQAKQKQADYAHAAGS